MILTKLSVQSFRNIETIDLIPHPTLNLIVGLNGSGKSSLLEAIQCLSTGHSFRTRKARELINRNTDSYIVTGQFQDPDTQISHRAGLKKYRDGQVEVKLDFEDVSSMTEISKVLPVKSLTPDSHRLIQDGPEERRRFIDWGVFHVEPQFLSIWKQYRRSLAQRNQLLRDHADNDSIQVWDELFAESGSQLNTFRQRYLDQLSERLTERLQISGLMFHVKLGYRSGWTEGASLQETIARNLDYHRKMKTTTDGPHRAELTITVDGGSAKTVLSRGEQKTLVYLLNLAQLDLLQDPKQAIMLCDDLVSELDTPYSQLLIDEILQRECQVFVSGVQLDALQLHPHQVFQMQRGMLENSV